MDDGDGRLAVRRHGVPVPVLPRVPPSLRNRVFRGADVVAAGLLTRSQLRGASWSRIWPDLYVHRDVEVTHALRARAAAALLVEDSVVTGVSAAVLWGVELAGPDDDVELTVPAGRGPVRVAGLRVRRSPLPEDRVVHRRGVRCTTPEATAVRIAASARGDDGVIAVDRIVAARVCGLSAVRELAATLTGAGSARARRVCALADGLAGSPQETRLRLLLVRAGLPPPRAQVEVRDAQGFVARVDLAWPEQRVAVEYDGLWHAEPGQFARDRRRLNRLHAAGWRVVFVTAADLHRPAEVLARIRAALACA